MICSKRLSYRECCLKVWKLTNIDESNHIHIYIHVAVVNYWVYFVPYNQEGMRISGKAWTHKLFPTVAGAMEHCKYHSIWKTDWKNGMLSYRILESRVTDPFRGMLMKLSRCTSRCVTVSTLDVPVSLGKKRCEVVTPCRQQLEDQYVCFAVLLHMFVVVATYWQLSLHVFAI